MLNNNSLVSSLTTSSLSYPSAGNVSIASVNTTASSLSTSAHIYNVNHSSALAAASAIAASITAQAKLFANKSPSVVSTSNSNILSSTSATMISATSNEASATTVPPPIVHVSLEIPLFTHEKLYPTPSMSDHLPFEVEFDLRVVGCELIQTAGRLLKLPQTAMATGQVLFHRYFYTKSFVKNPMEVIKH
jgi:hypothetical protein